MAAPQKAKKQREILCQFDPIQKIVGIIYFSVAKLLIDYLG